MVQLLFLHIKSCHFEGHVLAQRCLSPPAGSQSTIFDHTLSEQGLPLWCLHVDKDGSVCFSFCSLGGGSQGTVEVDGKKVGLSTVRSPPATINMVTTSGAEQTPGGWTHLAVVIDSSSALDRASQVSLIVNGALSAKGSLDVPEIDEKLLAVNTLFVGPDLCGWTITELRVWADLRSLDDVCNNKDNYLGLAAKRKRMIFGIKGCKELFAKPNVACKLVPPAATVTSLDSLFTGPQQQDLAPPDGPVGIKSLTGLVAPLRVAKRLQQKSADPIVDAASITVPTIPSADSATPVKSSNVPAPPVLSGAAAKRLAQKKGATS